MSDSPASTAALEADRQARQRIGSSLGESLLVEAAAGTGKTTQLVARLVAVLASGDTTVDRVVAVTFTRKAAGELQLRLRQELERARGEATEPDRRRHLEDAIARLEEANIGTIHSFCADVLRERPVEAGIDPAFRELDDNHSAQLYDRAFRTWVEHRLNEMPEGLRRALSRLAGDRAFDRSTPLERLRDAGRGLVDWRDFPAPWQRRPLDRPAAIDALLVQVHELALAARACPDPKDYLRRALEPAEELDAAVARAEQVAARDHDDLEARLLDLLRALNRSRGWKGRGPHFGDSSRADVQASRDQLLADLEAFKEAADAELAVLLRAELSEVLEGYEELKQGGGHLDFLDLLLLARNLIRDRPEVRGYLQARFSHIFVDEFQDTDPLQAEILLLLSADHPAQGDWRQVRPVAGKLFLVGDPKQSIYRFRRADVLLYQQIKRQLMAAGVALVHLTRSFRAVRPVQQAVNAAFAAEMTGDAESGQPEYVALDPHRPEESGQPPLIALPVPAPFAPWGKVTGRAIEESLPAAVAAFLDWLIGHSGWTVDDPEHSGRRLPVAPRHVCVLFRRFVSWGQDVTRDYTRALEARGLPHLLIGGRSFHQREEVETLRAALTAVEWPDDELAVFATLKGSLFAVPDDLLLRYRAASGRLHPFRPPPPDLPAEQTREYEPLLDALDLLARLHRQRNRRPIAETVHELLRFTRAHAGFALRPAGNQVLANVLRIGDLARSFELGGGLSFRGFVERLAEEAERIGSGGAPVLEEGAEGVRLMTVHAAKGLEFPVVVLADITAKLSRDDSGLYVDPEAGLCASRILGCAPWELHEHAQLEVARDRAEGVRIAYVAATRARDLLVVPAVGDAPFEGGWVSPLNRALYPPRSHYRRSHPAPGCPPFGERSVLERPASQDGQPEASVRPGLHTPEAGEHQVLWWDPATLKLRVAANFGLSQEDLLVADEGGQIAAAGEDRYYKWRSRRAEAQEAGLSPHFEVKVATEIEEPPPGPTPDLRVEATSRVKNRPSGPRFGTLVHTVLRDVDYQANEAAIFQLAELHGRTLEAPGQEVKAAVEAVSRALQHPLLRQAATSPRLYREAPFIFHRDPDRLLEGTLDLAFFDGDTWVVVDFKTDAELDQLGERYRRQLAWYVHALRQLTGQKARGVLLAV